MTTQNPFERLTEILVKLRGPDGCPWDKEQTHKTIQPHLLEEAHEVVETIDHGDFVAFKEELGDLLVQIFFHSQLASEAGRFNVNEVAQATCEKLIRRHPHIFGDTKAKDTKEVLENWEKIKAKEREGKKKNSLLDGLPKALPALVQAFRIGEKTSRVGFDWKDQTGPLEKIKEELAELDESLVGKNKNEIEHELGDLFTALANLSRHLQIDPETALRKANQRFIARFQWIETTARSQGRNLQDLSPAEWDRLWEEAKQKV